MDHTDDAIRLMSSGTFFLSRDWFFSSVIKKNDLLSLFFEPAQIIDKKHKSFFFASYLLHRVDQLNSTFTIDKCASHFDDDRHNQTQLGGNIRVTKDRENQVLNSTNE